MTEWVQIHLLSLSSKRVNFCLIPHLRRRNDVRSYFVRLLGSGKLMHI